MTVNVYTEPMEAMEDAMLRDIARQLASFRRHQPADEAYARAFRVLQNEWEPGITPRTWLERGRRRLIAV